MSPGERSGLSTEGVVRLPAPIRLFEASADDPKSPPRVAPIAVQHNSADWVVSLVQAMVYLPPLVPVIRDAAIGDSLWSAFVSLARRVRTRPLPDVPLAGLVETLDSAFEALLAAPGSGSFRSPESALGLLTVPAGSVFRSAFGADGFNLIKNISPRRPTRGTTNLALQFPQLSLRRNVNPPGRGPLHIDIYSRARAR